MPLLSLRLMRACTFSVVVPNSFPHNISFTSLIVPKSAISFSRINSILPPSGFRSSHALRSSESAFQADAPDAHFPVKLKSRDKVQVVQTTWTEAAERYFSKQDDETGESWSEPAAGRATPSRRRKESTFKEREREEEADEEGFRSSVKTASKAYGTQQQARRIPNGNVNSRSFRGRREADERRTASPRWEGSKGNASREFENSSRVGRVVRNHGFRTEERFQKDDIEEDRKWQIPKGSKNFEPQKGIERNESWHREEEEMEEEEMPQRMFDDRRNSSQWREWRKESSRTSPKIKGEAVYGIGPIYAALQVCRRELYCLYVQESLSLSSGSGKRKDKHALSWILRTASNKGLHVKEVPKHDLNLLVDNRPHQGLVLDASPLELVLINGLEAPSYDGTQVPVWVALDEVTDPQNFGAILRSAYFLGASGVVVCAKNSAPLSGVVSKASAGALEVMEVRSCRNMVKFLERSEENGWRTVGASAESKAISMKELPHGLPTILVLGSEGRGLRTNVKRACSYMVCVPGIASQRRTDLEIPAEDESLADEADEAVEQDGDLDGVRGGGDFTAVESLNVSVAAGILLHELLGERVSQEGLLSPSGS